MEGYIGEIRMFGGNFSPGSWNFCDGSLQSIAVYTALFSIIGTIYGGDGQQTFALPDFRGRIPVGTGQGPGLPRYDLGQVSGSENVTLTSQTMPMHSHITNIAIRIPAYSEQGAADPNGAILASVTNAYTNQSTDSLLAPFSSPVTLQPVGGGIPFSVMQPYLALNYIICMEGIFPSRN
ncbi:tail fiber protein [Fluviicola taffensis]|uniref:phage tail protein n=1 Tax=Fluviicola taffensis TaxID=191579 RepID=UPI003137D2E0